MSTQRATIVKDPVGFRIPTHLPEDVWQRIRSSGACEYYDNERLEGSRGIRAYDASPGWRYTAEAAQILSDQGVEVKFKSAVHEEVVQSAEELRSAVGVAEKKAEEVRKRRKREQEEAKAKADRAGRLSSERFDHNLERLTEGLIRVGGHYTESVIEDTRFICKKRVYTAEDGEVSILRSGVGRCGLWAGTSAVTGELLVVTTPGNMSVLHADEETAIESHRRQWENGGLDMALRIAREHLEEERTKRGTPSQTYGKEFRSWIWEERRGWVRDRIEGAAALVSTERPMQFSHKGAEIVAEEFDVEVLRLRKADEAGQAERLGIIYEEKSDGRLYAAVPPEKDRGHPLKEYPEWLPSLPALREDLGRPNGRVFAIDRLTSRFAP